jgi:hypothetical protein
VSNSNETLLAIARATERGLGDIADAIREVRSGES